MSLFSFALWTLRCTGMLLEGLIQLLVGIANWISLLLVELRSR